MAKPTPVVGIVPRGSFVENAARIVRFRLSDVLTYAPSVRDPSDARGLHDLRIAVKRLRYALEFLGPAFGRAVRDALAGAVELQEALGRVTDCDAFIRRLEAYEENLTDEEKTGLASLAARVRRTRAACYADAAALVAKAESEGLWPKLLRAIEQPAGNPRVEGVEP